MLKRKSYGRVLTAAAAAATMALTASLARKAQAGTFTWKTNASGAWNTGTNWTQAAFPNAAGDVADLSALNTTTTITVSLNQAVTIGAMKLGDTNGSNTYTIANGTGGSLTFDNSGSNSTLTHIAAAGADTISATLFLKNSLLVTNAANASLTISGAQSSSATSGQQLIAVLSGPLTNTGAISDGLTGGQIAVFVGSVNETSVFTGANTYSGTTAIGAGAAMRVTSTSLPNRSNLILNGGVLESSGAFTFNRALGTGSNQVQFAGSGGFSANGGKLTVNLNNNAGTLAWGSTANFLSGADTLLFGSTTSNNEASLSNGIDLNGATRTVQVTAGVGNDFGTIAGAIVDVAGSGTSGLTKTGTGTLQLTNAGNTYAGPTTVNGGAVRIGGTAGAGRPVNSNFVLNGGVIEGSSTFTTFNLPLGGGSSQVQWTGSGGFAANGAALTVNVGGAGQTLAFDSTPFFVTGTNALLFGSSTANRETIFQNPLDLNGALRTVQVIPSVNTTQTDFATLAGGLVNSSGGTSGLMKTGLGILNLGTLSNSQDLNVINGGSVRVSTDAALGNAPAGPTNNLLFTGSGAIQYGAAFALNTNRTIAITGNAVATIDTMANNVTFGNVVTGASGTLQKLGTGTMTLGPGATNSTTGAWSVNGGTLIVPTGMTWNAPSFNVAQNNGQSGTVTVAAGAVLNVGSGTGSTLTIATRNNGITTGTGTGMLDASAADTMAINVATLRIAVDFGAGANGPLFGTLKGAVNTSVTASTSVVVGDSGQEGSGSGSIVFGAGNNLVRTPTILDGGRKLNGSITIAPGGTLTVTNGAGVTALTIGQNNVNTGTFPVSTFNTTGGTLIANFGRVLVGEKSNGGAGWSIASFILGTSSANLVNMQSMVIGVSVGNGTATLGGGVVNLTGNITGGGGTSTLNLAGALVNMNGNSIGTNTATAPTTLTFTAGTLRNVSNVFEALTQTGNDSLLDVLSNSTTIVGAYSVTGGAANVNTGRTLTATSVTLAGGATLRGGGTVASSVTIGATGATVSPNGAASSIGSLAVTGNVSFGTNGTFAVDLGGGTSDRLSVGGSLDLTGPDTLNLADLGGAFDGITSYTIATFAALSGTFDVVNGLDPNYQVVYGASNIQVTPTPEPATLSLLALGAGGLLARRRRRRHA